MKRLVSSRKRVIALISVIALLVTASVGIAAWLVSSNGSAGGKFGTLTAPTVIATSTAGPDAFPGGALSLYADITNSNNTDLVVQSATKSGPVTTGDPACDAELNALTFSPHVIGVGSSILANDAATVPLLVTSLPSNLTNGCQGKTITVPVTVQFATP